MKKTIVALAILVGASMSLPVFAEEVLTAQNPVDTFTQAEMGGTIVPVVPPVEEVLTAEKPITHMDEVTPVDTTTPVGEFPTAPTPTHKSHGSSAGGRSLEYRQMLQLIELLNQYIALLTLSKGM